MAEANPREERSMTDAEGHEMKLSRKEKKKLAKKKKRKEKRREIAEKEREEAEAKMNDPEEQRKLEMMEKEEEERRERALKEFEERESIWIREMELKKEEERRKIREQEEMEEEEEEAKRKLQIEKENECDEGDDWEYVEEGPAEIIWQGNEIIIRKKKVKVPKKGANQQSVKEDADRPTSNPLPPQSEAFTDYQNAQQALETVARQVPNFGTEQDKAHCPFHLKTGVCRFGQSCSRVHFYPDKSCTLLIKNMYNGPGLAWEQDEGLEYTDEEVERSYEEFYEDVHTEFLKFGEIVNFKVCKNGSFHLRGNVYVHYVSLESAVDAYNSINGRYFAGKQIKCEFINVTRWKLAICGEYMKSRLKTCSHGTACNFIHCFRNPGGDYEWADWDKPPPKHWVKKMAALFGYSNNWNQTDQDYSGQMRNSHKINAADVDRHRSRRSKSREIDWVKSGSRRSYDNDEHDIRESTRSERNPNCNRKRIKLRGWKFHEDSSKLRDYHHYDSRSDESNSDGSWSDGERDKYRERHHVHTRKSIKHWDSVSEKSSYYGETKKRIHEDSDLSCLDGERDKKSRHVHTKRSSRYRRRGEVPDANGDSDSKTHEDDADMEDGDGNGERDHRHMRKRSRDRSKVKYLDSDGDNKIRDDVGSIRDCSDGDKDTDKLRRHKKKSSVDQSNNPKLPDDDVVGKHRTSDPDSCDDCLDRDKERHGNHGRKRSRKGSTAHKHSSRRSHLMKENSEANYGRLKSNEDHESGLSDQYDEKRSRKGDTNHRHSNISYSRKENSQTNYRHVKSNEDHESGSSDEYDGRCKSINEHDRWELVSPEEHWKILEKDY